MSGCVIKSEHCLQNLECMTASQRTLDWAFNLPTIDALKLIKTVCPNTKNIDINMVLDIKIPFAYKITLGQWSGRDIQIFVFNINLLKNCTCPRQQVGFSFFTGVNQLCFNGGPKRIHLKGWILGSIALILI